MLVKTNKNLAQLKLELNIKECCVVLQKYDISCIDSKSKSSTTTTESKRTRRGRKHHCNQCPWTTTHSSRKLTEHIYLKHTKLKAEERIALYQCQLCLRGFNHASNYHRHLQYMHSNTKKYSCQTCGKSFKLKEGYDQHLTIHEANNKLFSCNLCETSFRLKCTLIRHVKLLHSNIARKFKCSMPGCEYAAVLPNYLKLHEAVHKRNPNYLYFDKNSKLTCRVCLETFRNIESLGKHCADIHPKTIESNVISMSSSSAAKSYKCSISDLEKLNKVHTSENQNCLNKTNLEELTGNHCQEQTLTHKCHFCNRVFKSKSGLKGHIISLHQTQYTYSCSFCHYHCYRKEDLTEHYDKYHQNNPHFPSRDLELKLHNAEGQEVAAILKNHLYSCYECSAQFESRTKVISHFVNNHPELNPFKCAYCDETFRKWRDLNSHCNVHTGEKPFHCNQCPERFFNSQVLRQHKIENHALRTFSCDVCVKSFKTSNLRNEHMNHVHSSIKYSCNICEDEFRRIESLTIHINREHTKEFVHSCKYCNKSYGDINILRTHIKHVHHTEENLLQIPRPFKCNICQEAFKWKCQLESHIDSHTKEKPYKCKECGVCFKFETSLKYHVNYIHKDPVIFKCSDCSKMFTQSSSLKRHQEAKHNKKNKGKYQCTICKKMLLYKCSLMRHMKTYHC